MNSFTVRGHFLDTPEAGRIRERKGCLLVEDGIIRGFAEEMPEAWKGLPAEDFSGHLMIPGLCDMHLHAPQYSYCGLGMDVQLLEWLQKYTYPEESRYADLAYAEAGYTRFAEDLLHTCTTRACIFATIHTDSTLLLMRLLEERGLSCYVGKLNMDRNSPDSYREPSAAEGLAETRRWLDSCGAFRLSRPMLTPRFTPSVTDEYMKGLGELAAEYHVPMQSHLDENQDEIAWVKALCPDAASYADTYARYGLFGGECPTVMAHCIYCGEDTKQLIRDRGVMIAHCPTSNTNVIAGLAPAAEYLRNGFRIGLGSDVAGGHTLNLFEVMRCAIQISKIRSRFMDPSQAPLTAADCLYMATAGGGDFFSDERRRVGLLEEGYAFDACVLDEAGLETILPLTAEERLERYIYQGGAAPLAKYAEGTRIL